MNKERIKFVKDVFFCYLPPIVTGLKGLILIPIITKLMGSEIYGIWTQFNVTASLAFIFITLNLGHSMFRFLPSVKSKRELGSNLSSILSVVLSISVLIGLIGIIFRFPIASFLFGDSKYSIIIIYLAIFILLQSIFTEYGSFLGARRYFKESSLIHVVASLFQIGIIWYITVKTQSIWAILAFFVGSQFLITAGISTFVHSKVVRPYRPTFENIPAYLGFGVPLLPASLGYWVSNLSDRYIIGFLMNVSSVGIYSVGYGIGGLVYFMLGPMAGVLLPDLSALYDQGQIEELERRFCRVLKYYLALGIPAVIGLAILSKPLVLLLSTSEFVSAANVIILVAIGVFFFAVFGLYSQLLSVLKSVRTLSLLWIGMAIMNISLNFLLIPKFGIIGAAVATLVSFLLGAILAVAYIRKRFHISFRGNWLSKIALSSIIMAIVVHLIPADSIFMLIAAVLAGVVIYSGCLIGSGFVDQSERLLLKEILASIRRS